MERRTSREKSLGPKIPIIQLIGGRVVDQKVEAIVNSANGMLILGSGTAKDIRKAGGRLDKEGKRKYRQLLKKATGVARKYYEKISQTEIWDSKVQLECLQAILENNCKPLDLREVVLTSSGDLGRNSERAKWIIHAVGMSYDYQGPMDRWGKPLERISATKDSVRKAAENSLKLALNRNFKSIAFPIMCTRAGGLSAEKSFKAIVEAIEKRLDDKIGLHKIIIVGDNPLANSFIRKLRKEIVKD